MEINEHSILKIKHFDSNELLKNSLILIINKEQYKRIIINKLFGDLQNVPLIVIDNEAYNICFDQKVNPNVMVYNEYNQEIMSKLIDRQKIIIDQKPEKDCSAILILNYDGNNIDINNDLQFRELLYDHKQLQILIIMNMKYPLRMTPEYRSVIDYVFISPCDTNIKKYYKDIHDYYAHVFPKLNLFKIVFEWMTNNNKCMVLINNIHSIDLTNKVKYLDI